MDFPDFSMKNTGSNTITIDMLTLRQLRPNKDNTLDVITKKF